MFIIQEPIQLAVVDTAQSNVDCNGNNTGNVRLMGNGGNPGYQYSIDGVNFQPTPFFTGLAAGNYTVTILDDSSCTATQAITITEPPVLNGSIAALTQVDCNGNNSGQVTIHAQGGTAPYAFAINGITFSPDSTFSGLTAGNYTITIRDDSSCVTTVPVQITEPQPLVELLVGKTDVDCFGNANGSLTVSAMGGTAPYRFALANVTTFQASGTFLTLAPTNFNVVVRDAQLCRDTISVSITTPTGLTVNIDSIIHIGCHGDSTGKISITPSGGTGPYEVSFDAVNYVPIQLLTGLPAGNYPMRVRDDQNCIAAFSLQISEPSALVGGLKWQRDVACFGDSSAYLSLNASGGQGNYLFSADSLIFSSDSTLFNLPAGAYHTIILDDSSCSISVPVVIAEPPLLTSGVQTLGHISCFGLGDGSISLTTQGGVAPYSFSLDRAAFGPDSSYANLGPGNYMLTTRDDSACVVDIPVTILEPDTLILAVSEQINVACFGDSTAQITLQHSGGWNPHVYAVNGGSFTASPIFADLPIGNYTFTVRDDSSCTDQLSVTVTEPPLLTVDLAEQTNIDCFGNLTGAFAVTPGGGTPAYLYTIDGVNFVPDSSFSQLPAGAYTLTIQDDSSCTQSLEIILTEPDSLIVNATGIDVRCFEGKDGSVFADIQGGTIPYEILWNTIPPQITQTVVDLSKGKYAVSIIDSLGCTDTSSVFIDHPPLLELALGDTVHPYCDWANGSIAVSASGGISANYQYQWDTDPPSFEPNVAQLLGGIYTVVVVDENGCTDTLSVEIFNTPPATPSFFTDPPSDTTILLSKANIQFINTSEGAIAYLWNFGDNLGGSGEENPFYGYLEAGDYPVTLRAFNKYYECPADTTIILHIIPDGMVFYANAFTPNGDGYNDVYYFVGEGIASMEAQIFSRWGKRIALLSNPADGWNGRYNNTGEAVPEGVYTYVMRATLNDGSRVERSGTITLIR
jgi:gliding motility-associated-like protein